jgi:hypothetical protein
MANKKGSALTTAKSRAKYARLCRKWAAGTLPRMQIEWCMEFSQRLRDEHTAAPVEPAEVFNRMGRTSVLAGQSESVNKDSKPLADARREAGTKADSLAAKSAAVSRESSSDGVK